MMTISQITFNANQEIKTEKQRKRAENICMWQMNLITLYCAVCDNSSTIEAVMQRQHCLRKMEDSPLGKCWRGIATRHAKTTDVFIVAVYVRCIAIWVVIHV